MVYPKAYRQQQFENLEKQAKFFQNFVQNIGLIKKTWQHWAVYSTESDEEIQGATTG